MDLVTLYEQAIKGEKEAFGELKSYASSGNSQAQFLLSCIYDKPDSPFQDISLGMYWLKKSAEYGNVDANRKIDGLTPAIKHQYELDDVGNQNLPQNISHNTSYAPNWTRPAESSQPLIHYPLPVYNNNDGCALSWILKGLLTYIIICLIRSCGS